MNRVIIDCPPELPLKSVLTDIVEEGFLNGVDEHEICDGHCVIKRKTYSEAIKLTSYLNGKYGFIADLGVVKATKKQGILESPTQITVNRQRQTHVALLRDETAKHPNEHFLAFRHDKNAEKDEDGGMPVFKEEHPLLVYG